MHRNQWTVYSPNRNYRDLLEAVGTLRFADRDMLQRLLTRSGDGPRDGFEGEAIRRAVRSLKKRGYLRGGMWYVGDSAVKWMAGSKREVFWLGVTSRTMLGYGEGYAKRTRHTIQRMREDDDFDRIPHDLGLSRFHAFSLKGERAGLFGLDWKQGARSSPGFGLRPDAVCTYRTTKGYTYFIEHERRNKKAKVIRHFEKYDAAFDAGLKGWVLFLTETEDQARHLRDLCLETLGRDLPTTYRFLSEERYHTETWNPRLLFDRVVPSSRVDNPTVALIPE